MVLLLNLVKLPKLKLPVRKKNKQILLRNEIESTYEKIIQFYTVFENRSRGVMGYVQYENVWFHAEINFMHFSFAHC